MADGINIAVVVERRYMAQSQPAGLIEALEELGHDVRIVDPQRMAYPLGEHAWLDGLEIVVGRGRSWALMCLMAWAEERGVPVINTKGSIASVHNKADMSIRLTTNDMPVPRTWLGGIAELVDAIPDGAYPIILKPIFGDNCRGLVVVESPVKLASTPWDDPIAIAQTYHPTDGYDLKLYGIGDDVWAVRKPSPLHAGAPGASGRTTEAWETTQELVDLGRRCGRLFGLELFGVDCIVTPEGPLVIEVNDYPNFTAVPDANRRLAEFVLARAGKGRSG